MSWLDGLNQYSPDASPANGINDPNFDLSFPLDASELQRQLDQWTNVPFALDPPVNKRNVNDVDADELIRKNKFAAATHTSPNHPHAAEYAALNQFSANPADVQAHAQAQAQAQAQAHHLAYSNLLSLPAAREHARAARTAANTGLQAQTSPLFHQPLGAGFGMSLPAATSGISEADMAAFMNLGPMHDFTGPAHSAPPAALQALPTLPPTSGTIPQQQPGRAAPNQQKKKAKAAPVADDEAGQGNENKADRKASIGIAAPRSNSSAKSGVGTTAAAAAAAAAAASLDDPPNWASMTKAEIEEDKRRRNTAASARFRVKKKQREQALEASAGALRERVAELEKEVDTLKQENGWLRGLVVQKTTLADASLNADKGRKRLREEDDNGEVQA